MQKPYYSFIENPLAREVLEFWFGTSSASPHVAEQKMPLWFKKSEATDTAIREKFLWAIETASHGEFESWESGLYGALAKIILLDQFRRNIHRDTPEAFAKDSMALEISLSLIESGLMSSLRPIEKIFVLLPLEHSEELAHQELCVRLCKEIRDNVGSEAQEIFASFLDYAAAHRDVIAKFGRFPHRNAILGRTSTPDEQAYLAQPGSGF